MNKKYKKATPLRDMTTPEKVELDAFKAKCKGDWETGFAEDYYIRYLLNPKIIREEDYDDEVKLPSQKQTDIWRGIIDRTADDILPTEATEPAAMRQLFQWMKALHLGDKWVKESHEIDGTKVQLHFAGQKSKYNGRIMITDGGDYPNNEFYGTIDIDGSLMPARMMKLPHYKALVAMQAEKAGTSEFTDSEGNSVLW
jgi:hypothetical protein